VSGLVLCIEFFQRYGVKPVAICPSSWENKTVQNAFGDPSWEHQDFGRYQQLRQNGLLHLSPSGEHDDLYIIDYCFRTDGFLVSNDKYRDHSDRRNLNAEWIEQRRIGFMFVRDTFLPNPDHIQRLERFILETGKFLGGINELHASLMPPPPVALNDNNGEEVSMADVMNFFIPKSAIGFVIGKQGGKINEIQTTSSAKVEIDDKTKNAEGDVCVRLTGSPESCRRAREMVEEMVQVASRKKGLQEKSTFPMVKVAAADPVGYVHASPSHADPNSDADL